MPVAAQTGGAPARGQEKEQTSILAVVLRSLAIFAFFQVCTRFFFNNQTQISPAAVPSFDEAVPKAVVGEYNPVPQLVAPLWPLNSSVDFSIYVSSSLAMPPLRQAPSNTRIAHEEDFRLGDYKDKRSIDATFPVPKEAQHGGTLWAHIYVALHENELDPASSSYNMRNAYHFFKPINQVLPKKKVIKTKKLLGGSDDEESEDIVNLPTKAKFASYYHPNFTISFIPDSGVLPWSTLHPAVRGNVVLEPTGARDETGKQGWYYPIMFVNTFWQLRDHMMELNDTIKELPIHIDFKNQPNWQFSLIASIDDNVKSNVRNVANGAPVGAGGDGSEFEMFKTILLDSNPYLLATTFSVSILHMIFEMLAFKNDVSHWRNKKDNVGISLRTILANIVMQAIIFLYLMDNNENTSWMILASQGMGIVIEAWKITKTVDVKVVPGGPGSLLPYRVVFRDKHVLSETEKKTQEYDAIAFKYLYIVAVPLLVAYAVYSVLYESHKSWYSFIITTLVGSVYAYGFLMMVPSLYINYRLKSVAHMPGKAMMYKFLNTFIDDLFAFTIKMPTLHRLATLRDDVIFFIYLYQTWVYKVDMTRINEFGQGGDDEELEEKTANKPLVAPPDADGDAGVDKAVATGKEGKGAVAKKRK